MTLAAAIALLAFGGPSNAAPTAPRAHIPHSSDPNYRRLLKIYADNPAVPLDAQVVQGHRTTDSRRFHVIFHGADAKPIPATYFEYIRASAWHPVPAIILIHGISRGSDEMQQFGFFLAATGYAVLVVDESERLDTARSTDQIVVGLRRSVTDIRRAVTSCGHSPTSIRGASASLDSGWEAWRPATQRRWTIASAPQSSSRPGAGWGASSSAAPEAPDRRARNLPPPRGTSIRRVWPATSRRTRF